MGAARGHDPGQDTPIAQRSRIKITENGRCNICAVWATKSIFVIVQHQERDISTFAIFPNSVLIGGGQSFEEGRMRLEFRPIRPKIRDIPQVLGNRELIADWVAEGQ
jgi:hypothetical protein